MGAISFKKSDRPMSRFSKYFRQKFQNAVFSIDPETAHGLSIAAIRYLCRPPIDAQCDDILRTSIWGREFVNPIGLAAGFDKNCTVADRMFGFGFGFVETGTVTPLPQSGNDKPRVFRLAGDRAVINRLGFNNSGLDNYVAALAQARRNAPSWGVIGANVGMNRNAVDPCADIHAGVSRVYQDADYIVVNISSPNTPGLRDWQQGNALSSIVDAAMSARNAESQKWARQKPLLFKIAPDLNYEQVEYIASVAADKKLDGVIISNTTIDRPAELESEHSHEKGGLSGRPLMRPSTRILRQFYRFSGGKIPLIGVGGVSSGHDAYRKIKAGASLVQLYTAMVYHGPWIARQIALELAELLRADGLKSPLGAVGVESDMKYDDNIHW